MGGVSCRFNTFYNTMGMKCIISPFVITTTTITIVVVVSSVFDGDHFLTSVPVFVL